MDFLRTDIYNVITYFLVFGLLIALYSYFLFSEYRRIILSKAYNFSVVKNRYFIKISLLFIAFILLSIGFFGPYFSIKNLNTSAKNIVFVVDLSKSMDAEDSLIGDKKYSRLDSAKHMILSYMSKYPANSYSIIGFSDAVITFTPLTEDMDQLVSNTESISTNSIGRGGTNLTELFKFITSSNDKNNYKNFIIFSDGEDLGNFDSKALKLDTSGLNLKIFTIGIGSEKGAYIPDGANFLGDVIYKSYDGARVVTKLDSNSLSKIASITNGYYQYGDSFDIVSKFNTDLLSSNNYKFDILRKSSDNGYYFCAIGFAFLIFSYLVNYKKNNA